MQFFTRLGAIARAIALLCLAAPLAAEEPIGEPTNDLAGRSREEYIVTPVNQLLTPYGRQVELAGLRPQALAISPDGRLLVASGKTSELVVIDSVRGEIKQRVKLPAD